jgi:exosortase
MERASRGDGVAVSASGRWWKGRIAAYASSALIAFLLGLIYHRTAAGLWTIWTTNDNYSHGSLVPLVSLALVVSRRERLRVLPRAGDWRGIALVALACGLQVVGARADVFTLQGWSIVVMLFGLVLGLLGGPLTRVLAFPIGYLVFMLTFPPIVMNRLSFALKEVAVQVAARASEVLGVTLQRSGMTLWLAGGTLEIENPCSGLRSLLAMLATGVLLASLLPSGWWRRALLVLLAVPMAIAGNALRITLLVLMAHYVGIKQALGTFHDVSGYLTYALSLGGLLAVWALLQPRGPVPERRP